MSRSLLCTFAMKQLSIEVLEERMYLEVATGHSGRYL